MRRKPYTLKQLARRIPYTERTLRRMCKDGRLKGAFQLPGGRKWLIPAEPIEEYLTGKPYRPYLGPLVNGYIVMDIMPGELYEWLTANSYKAYPLRDGNITFIRVLRP
jgi:excisionase family DNA binding protein